MKIFPKPSSSAAPAKSKAPAKEGKESKGISRKKPEAPARKEMSADQIKEKLAAHVDTSEAAKNMAVKNTKRLGEGFMNESIRPEMIKVEAPVTEEKPVNSKDLTLKSDIAMNDPKDTNTQEKLKTVLSRGAFNFNSKERDALEKILAG